MGILTVLIISLKIILKKNTNNLTKSPLVLEYEKIIAKENAQKANKKERKKRKNKNEEDIHEKRNKKSTFLYGKSTLFEKIQFLNFWMKRLIAMGLSIDFIEILNKTKKSIKISWSVVISIS